MPSILPANCLELLQAMVAIPSVVPYHSKIVDSERNVGECVANVARGWGFVVNELPVAGHAPNVLVCHERAAGLPWLLFDSHLDTVGVEGMTVDPFVAAVRDGRVWGRGVVDTKGTGAAMLWALRQYANDESGHYNIAIAYTVAEEHVQSGARAMANEQLARLGIEPLGVVVGEPTGLHVVGASGGFLRWYITTRGKAFHSTRPDLGHNAVSDMARLITLIEEQYIDELSATNPLVGRGVAAITTCRGGIAMNIIPDHCVATLDRRLVPGEDAAADDTRLRQLCDDFAQQLGATIEVSEAEFAPPLAPADDLRLARHCQATLRKHDIAAEITGALYTSNANHYAAVGLPTVVLGPGDIAQAHQPDEWLELAELDRGVKAYLALMREPPLAHQT